MAEPRRGPTTYVLVHGTHSAGVFWMPIARALTLRRHRVVMVDQPWHGTEAFVPESYQRQDLKAMAVEPSPLRGLGLDDYEARVTGIVRRAARNGPVVLVGHSLGGVSVSRVGNAVARGVGAPCSTRLRRRRSGRDPVVRPAYHRARSGFRATSVPLVRAAGPAIPRHRVAASDLPTCWRMRGRCPSQRRRGRWDGSGTASRAAYGSRRSGGIRRGALVVLSKSDNGRRDTYRARLPLWPFSPAVPRGSGSRQDRLRGRSARTPHREARAGS
ncbi:alpha/beta fold hydrolase [Streptomyces sp. NPDC005263]|uniref:alpha/beta fold hydrolase n=1 Tax=Streptomyces sp. NPDC005263 TaxID=3364711 RepID=UPI0036AFA652